MGRILAIFAAAASLYRLAHGQCSEVSNQTYDYIVIGSGAAGIPMADRLSEAGHSVLLVEKGPLSTGYFNGTMKPDWLNGTNLTRFDVPGLFNEIWRDPTNVACDDYDVMAGCVLGGGVAVNSALWWKPNPRDYDYNFPTGWKNSDMEKYINIVWGRIPGTYIPSMDGKLYLQGGFDAVSKGLEAGGFKYVIPNDHPDEKNFTYGHSTFFLEHAERQGPLRTYLETAALRSNFKMMTNTMAQRVVRTGGHVSGVEFDCVKNGTLGAGFYGTVNLTPKTGRVILSAGTFGSAKLLLRSGIGPEDQLKVVNASSDGPTMISSDQWINLPVGYNLNDHVGTDIQVSHPNITFYDFYAAYDTPIQSDADKYLANRTGILTQVAPNLGPMFWMQYNASDGIVRHTQYQARIEGRNSTAMTITQYLGTGTQSRGRMTIGTNLDTRVSTAPYLRNAGDKESLIAMLDEARKVLSMTPGLSWITPTPDQNTTSFVNSMPATPALRTANHWIGTCTIGTDDGRVSGGKAVVDLNTKVYGMDNLFVVDASIFPGITTGNPSGSIIPVAEMAAARILALKA